MLFNIDFKLSSVSRGLGAHLLLYIDDPYYMLVMEVGVLFVASKYFPAISIELKAKSVRTYIQYTVYVSTKVLLN